MFHVEFSFLMLFTNADIFGKIVIAILLLLSIVSWAIIIYKFFLLRRVRNSSRLFVQNFKKSDSLFTLADSLSNKTSEPTEKMFISAVHEWKVSLKGGEGLVRDSLKERIEKVLEIALQEESDRLEKHLPFLATVSATAPFIGLFGTVWGIMNAFQSIAASKQTNLAVVAPGISEALFATALGLIAAIPAAYFYNHFTNQLNNYISSLERFSAQFMIIISRYFDKKLNK